MPAERFCGSGEPLPLEDVNEAKTTTQAFHPLDYYDYLTQPPAPAPTPTPKASAQPPPPTADP